MSTPYGGLTIGRPCTVRPPPPPRRRRRRAAAAGAAGAGAGAAPAASPARRSLRRIGRAAEAGPFALAERLPGRARDVADVGESRRRLDQADRRDAERCSPARRRCAFPDRRPTPGQLVPPPALPMFIAPSGPFDLADAPAAGTSVPACSASTASSASRAQLRREVDQIVRHVDALARVGRRLGRERLRRRRLLARHVGLRHRPLFDRPHRLAGDAIEHVEERLLARQRDRLDRLAVDVDVEPGSAPTRGRSPRSDDARSGSATCAGRSSDRRRPGSRRTGCCPDGGRRRSPRSAISTGR